MLYSKFQKISRACSRNFTQFHAIFTQFWLFQPFLGQFQHVGYQNACTRAEKFIGNTFKKFHARVHAISRNFHAIWTISAIFGPISTCWVSKSMYSSWEIQWWYFHTLSRTPSCNFTQFTCNFTQFQLFQPFLGQFQHVEYQNVCPWAEKFNGDIFTHFHTLLQALSHKFHAISHNFGYFSYLWVNFNILGIKMHVFELRSLRVILSHTFTHSLTQFHAIYTQFNAILDISALFGPKSTCWVSKCMYLSWEIQWW